jgi:UDP-glucose 4-epimerase
MVLPNFVSTALRGDDLPIFGDGKQSRCFVDVRDVAESLPRILAAPKALGAVMNLGSDRSLTMEELADLVIATLGSTSRKRLIPYDEAYSRGFEDLRRRAPDLTRVRAAIGFSPRFPLEQTIRDIAAMMKGRGIADAPSAGAPSR